MAFYPFSVPFSVYIKIKLYTYKYKRICKQAKVFIHILVEWPMIMCEGWAKALLCKIFYIRIMHGLMVKTLGISCALINSNTSKMSSQNVFRMNEQSCVIKSNSIYINFGNTL